MTQAEEIVSTKVFNEAFNQADKVVHTVEKEWHYKYMAKYGYIADTKEAIGFVRSYEYHHPITGNKVECCTGAHADYWRASNMDSKDDGYWASLEPYLKRLNQ